MQPQKKSDYKILEYLWKCLDLQPDEFVDECRISKPYKKYFLQAIHSFKEKISSIEQNSSLSNSSLEK